MLFMTIIKILSLYLCCKLKHQKDMEANKECITKTAKIIFEQVIKYKSPFYNGESDKTSRREITTYSVRSFTS